MADSAIAITAGSGTNVDTRTEATNGQHRQVVVIGDPSLNAGVATVKDASTGAAAATDPALVVTLRDMLAAVQGGAPVTLGAVVPTATANGSTSSRVKAAASTNATNLKASAGQIYSIDVFNNAAYNVFLKLYNKASSPTVGTDVPVWTIPVPTGGGYAREFPRGKTFATGISYAITKLEADSDTTVVVADDLTGSIDWI